MTTLFTEALERASKLPENLQDMLAEEIIECIRLYNQSIR